jgi:transcriptional regulator NrdR family protein
MEEQGQITVVKRDGAKEPYNEDKIKTVVNTAGLDSHQSEALAITVTEWIKSSGKKEVTSLEIRDKVLKELKSYNENVSNLFDWYEKTKENNN